MSSHEAIARARKVTRLVALVRANTVGMPASQAAKALQDASPMLRAAIAKAAGVREPSSLTWAWTIAAVRESA